MAANDKKNHEDIKNMLVVLNDIYKSSYIFNVHKIQNELLANDIIYVNMRMLIDINNMCLKVKSCIDLYNSISTGYKESNYQLNIKLCNFLFNYLFYIYQYYIIVNDYILYYPTTIRPTKRPKHSTPSVPVQNLNFFQYIDTYIKPTTSYTSIITSLSGYKKFIIYRFNKEIFDDNNSSTELLLLKSYIYLPPSDGGYNLNANIYNANHIISNIDNIKNYIREFKKYIIKDIFILPFDNNYIAIPQFEGICWFISMLCGITYSDMSKNLLIKKRTRRISASANTFKKFAYDIIDNITRDFKKYNTTTIYSDCELLIALKFTPLNVFRDILDAEVRSKDKDYYMKILYKLCSEIDDNEIENQQTKSSIIFDNIYNKKINTIDNICIGILLEEIFKTDFIFKTVLDKTPYKESYTIEQKKRIIALHIYNNILVKFLEKGLISLLPKYDFNNYGISFNQNNILSHLYDLLNMLLYKNYYYGEIKEFHLIH